MTIGGVSRVEFGDGKDPKEAIGNFIRRGAMRFGVAIDLWSREELSDAAGTPASDRSGEDGAALQPGALSASPGAGVRRIHVVGYREHLEELEREEDHAEERRRDQRGRP